MKMKNGESRELIRGLSDGSLTCRDMASMTGLSESRIQSICRENGFPMKHLPQHRKKKSPENIAIIEKIKRTANGELTSQEIAEIVGSSAKYVQRVMLANNLPRLAQRAPMYGEDNPAWVGGRMIDLGGYVLVSAPNNHPYQRRVGSIYEHRLVVEKTLGRFLLPEEVVDHIDEITIHNHPSNLRLFSSNRDHLRATISGQIPSWSEEGRHKLKHYRQQPGLPRVDKHYKNKERGDVRLRSILRAWLSLDKDSPYLLGTRHWLEQAGIVDLSRSSLEHHLQLVLQRMA